MRLFIVHSGTERRAAWELATILDTAGHEAWLDGWLLNGSETRDQVKAAVEGSAALIYILSAESVENGRCRAELNLAIKHKTPVVVVRFTDTVPTPEYLKSYTMVDFTPGPTPLVIGHLIDVLLGFEGQHAMADLSDEIQASGPRRPLSSDPEASLIAGSTIIMVLIGLFIGNSTGPAVVTDVGLMTQLFVIFFQLWPAALFMSGAVLFTAIQHSFTVLVLILALEIALLVGYLLTPAADFPSYVLRVGLVLIAYLSGQTQIWLWPVRSYRLNHAYRQLKQAVANGQFVKDCAEPVLQVLNLTIALPLANEEQVMQTLADGGLTCAQFNVHVSDLEQQKIYQGIVQATGCKRLQVAPTLPVALQVIETYQLASYDTRSLLAVLLQKLTYSETSVEWLRVTAQFLWSLTHELRPALRKQWPEQTRVVQFVQDMVYANLDISDVARYWMTYHSLDATVEEVLGLMQDNNRRTRLPYDAIQDEIYRLGQVQAVISTLEVDAFELPLQEKDWHHALSDIDLNSGHFLAMDYQDRQANIVREINYLEALILSQPADFLTIDQIGTDLLNHNNPWCTLTSLLLQLVESIQSFDQAYIAWAEGELSRTMEGLLVLEDLLELEQQFVNLTIAGDSFGPMVDGTLRLLLEISQELQLALRWEEGSPQYHQGLIEALSKSDALYRWLQTRYSRSMPGDWPDSVRQIRANIQDRLNRQPVLEETQYLNPYITGNPIPETKPTLFKGRRDLAQKVIDILRRDNHPTLILHGPRRMGKTSFLLHLHNLMRGWAASPLTVVVGGQEPGLVTNDANFFFFLSREIYKRVSYFTGLQISRPEIEMFERRPYATFTPWLEDDVLPLLGEQRLLITIDEFEKVGEAIRERQLSERVLDFLRHTSQHNEQLLFLFCGVATLDALGPNAASYFIGAQAIEIGYLDKVAARELICDPNMDLGQMPAYSRTVVNEIMRLTHNQPYLIQALCSKIVDAANVRGLQHIKKPMVAGVIPDVFTVNSLYFENIWFDAKDDGQAILTKLAAGPEQLTVQELTGAGQGLLKRHVICPVEGAEGLYQIEIPLVQQWVAARVQPVSFQAMVATLEAAQPEDK